MALTHARLTQLLRYDPGSGLFYWREDRRCGEYNSVIVARSGEIAGGVRPDGYVSISLDMHRYLAHVLVWFYVHGLMPSLDVDHVDRDRSNNRISNLRLATRSQNHQNLSGAKSHNKTSGILGVHWDSQRKKWRAAINLNKKRHDLGFFADLDEAIKARIAGEQRLFTHAPTRQYN
jgi:hypothetical protein